MRASAENHRGLRDLTVPTASREKFEPDGAAKPLFGFTLVQWIDPGTDLFARLLDVRTDLAQSLGRPWVDAEGMSRDGIARRFAFLPPETYHLTIYDLVVEPDSATREALPGLVTDVVFPELAAEAMAPPTLWSQGVVMMGRGSLAAMVHPSDRRSLEPYLAGPVGDWTILLTLNHRQVGEAAAELFLSGDDGPAVMPRWRRTSGAGPTRPAMGAGRATPLAAWASVHPVEGRTARRSGFY